MGDSFRWHNIAWDVERACDLNFHLDWMKEKKAVQPVQHSLCSSSHCLGLCDVRRFHFCCEMWICFQHIRYVMLSSWLSTITFHWNKKKKHVSYKLCRQRKFLGLLEIVAINHSERQRRASGQLAAVPLGKLHFIERRKQLRKSKSARLRDLTLTRACKFLQPEYNSTKYSIRIASCTIEVCNTY